MGTGRKKIEIKKVENIKNRRVTFTKRRQGLFRKAIKLQTLTGCQIAIITFSPSMNPNIFGHLSLFEPATSADCSRSSSGGLDHQHVVVNKEERLQLQEEEVVSWHQNPVGEGSSHGGRGMELMTMCVRELGGDALFSGCEDQCLNDCITFDDFHGADDDHSADNVRVVGDVGLRNMTGDGMLLEWSQIPKLGCEKSNLKDDGSVLKVGMMNTAGGDDGLNLLNGDVLGLLGVSDILNLKEEDENNLDLEQLMSMKERLEAAREGVLQNLTDADT